MLDKTNKLMSQFRIVKEQVDSFSWSLFSVASLFVPEANVQTDEGKWEAVCPPSR